MSRDDISPHDLKRATKIVSSVSVASVALGAFLIREYMVARYGNGIGTFIPAGRDRLALAFGLILAGAGGLNLLMAYLSGRFSRFGSGIYRGYLSVLFAETLPSTTSSDRLKSKLESLQEDIETLKRARVLLPPELSAEDLVKAVAERVQVSMPDDLKERYIALAQDKATERRTILIFHSVERRLLQELGTLRRRANLALAFGVLTTIGAVGFLSYLVTSAQREFVSTTAVLAHFLPQVALAVFVELFAFFFLRLYRASLSEIRVYQADLTRLGIQRISVELARADSVKPGLTAFATSLLGVNKPAQESSAAEEPDGRFFAQLAERAMTIASQKN